MPRNNSSNGRVVRIHNTGVPTTKVAVLLPLTLRNPDAWQNFVEFLRSFAIAFGGPITSKKLQATAATEQSNGRLRIYKYCFFVGVDMMPLEVDEEKATNHIAELFNRVLSPYRSNFESTISIVPIGDCRTEAEAFNELGKAGYQSQEACDYFLLATEHIRFKQQHISALFQGDYGGGRAMDDVISYFKHFAVRSSFSNVGTVGCVSLLDETLPSTPSVPLVHRIHLQVFQGELLPNLFPTNSSEQDEGDNVEEIRAYQDVLGLKSNLQDFIFEIHFRLGAAKILSDSISVTRDKYDPEARQVRHPQQADVWAKHVPKAVERYLEGIRIFGLDANNTIKRRIAMDVVVPSFRTPKHVIERILKLPRDEENLAVRIIVVCDNPMSKEAVNSLAELEKDHETDFACKIRVNKVNLGPGGTRSQGLLESPGEYVLFLDDDVLPEPVLLPEYARLIHQYPNASGFVGQTALPEAVTPKQIGFIRSRIAFGWDFARESKSDLSWGITANLCVKRRSGVLFDPVGFPKGGGGEDVDFCLRVSQQSDERYFLPAPVACVHHPWWDNGNPRLHHFVCWAKGDRRLIRHHPEKSFWNLPDCVETTAALGLFIGPTLVLNGKISLSSWFGLLVAQPLGEIVYEVISMRHLDLFKSHGPIFALKTSFYSAIVSLCHELGRFLGHVEDGVFTVPFCTQFDWYKTHRIPPQVPKQDLFRFDFAQQERVRLLKRSICRWMVGLVLCLLLKRGRN